MKTCLNCGKKLENGEMFCAECGAAAPADPQVNTTIRFCPECGQKLEGSIAFCPNCGTNVKEEEDNHYAVGKVDIQEKMEGIKDSITDIAGKVSGGGKNKLFLVGGVAIALVLVLILTQTVFASPAKKFKKYQKEFFVEMAMGTVGDYADLYNEVADFSTDVTISAETDDPYLEDILDGTTLVLKGELDKSKVAMDAKVNLMGNNVASGYLSYDGGKVAFYAPEFDKHLYEVDLTKSNPVSNLLDIPEGVENLEVPSLDTKTLNKLTQEYLGLMLDIANKDNTSVQKGTTIELVGLDEDVKGDLYVLEPTAEELEATMLEFAAKVKKDENLKNFVNNSLGSNKVFIEEVMGVNYEDELDDAIDMMCDQIEDNASETAEYLESCDLRWELAVSGGDICYNALIIGSECMAYNAYGNSVAAFIPAGDTIYEGIVLDYKKDGKLYNGTIELYNYGEVEYELEFEDVNLKEKSSFGINHGTYTLTNPYYGEEVFVLEVAKADNDGTDHIMETEGIELVINTTDKKSTISKPKADTISINDYSRRDLEELAYELEEYFNGVGEALDDIM